MQIRLHSNVFGSYSTTFFKMIYIIFFFSNVTLCYEKWFQMTRLGGRHGRKSRETLTCLVAGKNNDYVAGSRICHVKVKSSRGTTNAETDLFQTSFLCPRIERSGAYCFTAVCPSVCLHKLHMKT